MTSDITQEEEDLVDYEEEELANPKVNSVKRTSTLKKGHYVGIHSSGFQDFLLKPELMNALVEAGFEHPSEVQNEAIPQAILGSDILCQAKSGMGKTAIFVLASLQLLDPVDNQTSVLVLAHTRELAYQIVYEYQRFSKYLPTVSFRAFYGGVNVQENKDLLAARHPSIVVGTPGRILQLVRDKSLDLSKIRFFVLDECDKMLEALDMRRDVQSIFLATPHDKQVMMFSATLSKEVRDVCRKFMRNPLEIFIDDETKLTLHGLRQFYKKISDSDKNKILADILDALDFNQLLIFVSKTSRANKLNKLLVQSKFPSVCIHSRMSQDDRIARYKLFKNFEKRILVTTDLFGRGIDIEKVNIVINYDFPSDADSYLHRVGRAGRFGTKGLSISFVSSSEEGEILNSVQSRFEIEIPELPDSIDVSTYMS